MAEGCGADMQANALMISLLDGKDFTVPPVDLTGPEYQIPDPEPLGDPTVLTNAMLTTGEVGGNGTFDAMMASLGSHMKAEYGANRITGQEYAKAYMNVTTAALGAAVQYLLGKDQAYWGAVMAKNQARQSEIQVIQSRVELETAKVRLRMVEIEALTTEANYALAKMRLATEDAQYCNLLAQKDQIVQTTKNLVAEEDRIIATTAQIEAQTAQVAVVTRKIESEIDYTEAQIVHLGKQSELIDSQILNANQQRLLMVAQTAGVTAETARTTQQTTNLVQERLLNIAQTTKTTEEVKVVTNQAALLDTQNDTLVYQLANQEPLKTKLIQEQYETQFVQTRGTNSTGIPISGVLGAQIKLWEQQVTSYQRDAEIKAAKIFADAWITQKTIDEGLLAPDNFTNTSINAVFNSIKSYNKIGNFT